MTGPIPVLAPCGSACYFYSQRVCVCIYRLHAARMCIRHAYTQRERKRKERHPHTQRERESARARARERERDGTMLRVSSSLRQNSSPALWGIADPRGVCVWYRVPSFWCRPPKISVVEGTLGFLDSMCGSARCRPAHTVYESRDAPIYSPIAAHVLRFIQ